MNELVPGFWETADRSLQWIGKGALRLTLGRSLTGDESTRAAATGGALVCALFGGVVGLSLSDRSQDIGAIGATVLGGSLGVCLGICFGAFVETVDRTIQDLLRFLSLK